MAKKTKAQQYAELTTREVGMMKTPELKKVVVAMRSAFTRRTNTLSKKGLVSHAVISYKRSSPPKRKSTSAMNRNQLLAEWARLSSFFTSRTSSEKGIREVNREQDIRIFGADKKGNPLRTMTNDERERYWDLYEEFKVQESSTFHNLQSGEVQHLLQDAIDQHDSDKGLTTENISQLLSRAAEQMDKWKAEQNREEFIPNVYG